jgi:hypothetical protein
MAMACLSFHLLAGAGIRTAGKYSGVVIFDRWDGCIVFSSVYLMYISESVKEDLRPYVGQAIEIDALDVFQPMNPGDGLIRKYRIIGPAADKYEGITLDALVLTAAKVYTTGSPSAVVEIRNIGRESIRVDSSEIGLALMMKKQGYQRGDPSDGPSTAVITRANVLSSDWRRGSRVDDTMLSWSFEVDPNDPFPEFFSLAPSEVRRTTITFHVPPGEYEFFFGYGGGVHEERSLASNPVSFDVD